MVMHADNDDVEINLACGNPYKRQAYQTDICTDCESTLRSTG